VSLHRLLQAKNHQWTLWQACGTWMTILKGVEASRLIERNQRLCSGRNVFGIQEVLDFLVQPTTVITLSILQMCVSLWSESCLVEGQWQRKKSTSAIYIVKWGEIRSLSEKKFPSLCLYMCLYVSEVYDDKATVGRICWVQSLCIVHSLTAEEDLVSFWMQVLMLSCIHVWQMLLHSCWSEKVLWECLIGSHPPCVWMSWSWSENFK